MIIISENEYDPVGYLKIKKITLEDKPTSRAPRDIPRLNFVTSHSFQPRNEQFKEHIYFIDNEEEKKNPFVSKNRFQKSTNQILKGERFGHVILKPTTNNQNASISDRVLEQMAQIEPFLDQVYYVQIFIKDMNGKLSISTKTLN